MDREREREREMTRETRIGALWEILHFWGCEERIEKAETSSECVTELFQALLCKAVARLTCGRLLASL